MFNKRRLLAFAVSVACLLIPCNVLAANPPQCLNAAPDSECFQDLVLDVGGSVVIDIDKPSMRIRYSLKPADGALEKAVSAAVSPALRSEACISAKD